MAVATAGLRRQVAARAGNRCEYCLLQSKYAYLPHEVDHIVATKHSGQTTLDNLCLSCFFCNRYKGSDLTSIDPLTGDIVRLFNPRRDQWDEHFRLVNNRIEGITPSGRATSTVLQFNSVERLLERQLLISHNLYP